MTKRDLSPEEIMLRSALQEADPVPDNVTEYARAVFQWRNIDLELASLVLDTTADAIEGVRGAGDVRFSFTGPADSTLELTYDAAEARLTGAITSSGDGTCELLTPSGSVPGSIEAGQFEFTDVPSGPVSVAVRLDDGRSFKTEWMTL